MGGWRSFGSTLGRVAGAVGGAQNQGQNMLNRFIQNGASSLMNRGGGAKPLPYVQPGGPNSKPITDSFGRITGYAPAARKLPGNAPTIPTALPNSITPPNGGGGNTNPYNINNNPLAYGTPTLAAGAWEPNKIVNFSTNPTAVGQQASQLAAKTRYLRDGDDFLGRNAYDASGQAAALKALMMRRLIGVSPEDRPPSLIKPEGEGDIGGFRENPLPPMTKPIVPEPEGDISGFQENPLSLIRPEPEGDISGFQEQGRPLTFAERLAAARRRPFKGNGGRG